MTKLTTVSQVLPTDFISADEYTVIEPGLSNFNQDQTITHKELLEYLKDNSLNTIDVLPMCSFNSTPAEKDYDIMKDKVALVIDKCNEDMSKLISDYNEKYEEDENASLVNDVDLPNLFSQLDDYVTDFTDA